MRFWWRRLRSIKGAFGKLPLSSCFSTEKKEGAKCYGSSLSYSGDKPIEFYCRIRAALIEVQNICDKGRVIIWFFPLGEIGFGGG